MTTTQLLAALTEHVKLMQQSPPGEKATEEGWQAATDELLRTLRTLASFVKE